MNVLSEKDIIHIWEAGQDRPLWFRAMLILSQAFPGMELGRLADMTIGQRNFCLLKLRRRMVGSAIDARVLCPACGERLEFKMDVDSICSIIPSDEDVKLYSLEIDGFTLQFRPMTSRDLADSTRCREPEEARAVLLRNCISNVWRDRLEIDFNSLDPDVIIDLGDKIAEIYDPQVEIQFSMSCPTCDHKWVALFDIVSFFWTEIDVQARRVLEGVQTLARTYGWSETEILNMNAARKNYYLQGVS